MRRVGDREKNEVGREGEGKGGKEREGEESLCKTY